MRRWCSYSSWFVRFSSLSQPLARSSLRPFAAAKNRVDVPPENYGLMRVHRWQATGIARWQVLVDSGRKEKRVNYTPTSTCP